MENINNLIFAVKTCYRALVNYDMACPKTTAALMNQHLASIDAVIGLNLTHNYRVEGKPNYSKTLCNSIRLIACSMSMEDKDDATLARVILKHRLQTDPTWHVADEDTLVTLHEYFSHTGNFSILKYINQEIELGQRDIPKEDRLLGRAKMADEINIALAQ